MEYSLSFDASLKVKNGQQKGFINHLARDVFDKENGYQLNHKNDKINKSLTAENITFVNDGNENIKPMESIKEATDYLDSRLSTVKKTLRKDAVISRPLIFQLDSEYIKSHDEGEVLDRFNDIMNWAADEFGIENIVCGSIHMDETNPHLHLMFTPVTEDGRLAQKDWFKNPTTLRKQHDNLRKYMQDRGYNATNERVTGARKGLDLDEFKSLMNMKEKQSALESTEVSLGRRKRSLDKREDHLDTLALKIEEKALKEAERVLKQAEDSKREAENQLALANKRLVKAQEQSQEIIEQAQDEAKRIRMGAEDLGKRTKKLVGSAEELTEQEKRQRQFQAKFGHIPGV